MCLSDMANSVKDDVMKVMRSFGAYISPNEEELKYISQTQSLLLELVGIFQNTTLNSESGNKSHIQEIVSSLNLISNDVAALRTSSDYKQFVHDTTSNMVGISTHLGELKSNDRNFTDDELKSFIDVVLETLIALPEALHNNCLTISDMYAEFRRAVSRAVAKAKSLESFKNSMQSVRNNVVRSNYDTPSANARFRELVLATRAAEDEPVRRSVRWH